MKLLQRVGRLIYLFLHPEEAVGDLGPAGPDDPVWNESVGYSMVWGSGWRDLFKQLK
ncbi:MAG: hypothetical protein JO083_02680 [Candidatus Eremiobacteraeota bacterium]|nr:hypothetical protein [Candidatus Eremiobacteraeota bacterium]MBV8369961.1 hypothetical protein [Candidatus Eremiobacteraeota bacterium]